MRRRRSYFHSISDEEETSLTPLIDVVFVVLILFILVAPMVEIDRIQLADAPAREVADTVTPSSLCIYVRNDDSIWINKQSISPENIGPLLKTLHQEDPKKNLQLYQDKNAHFRTYQLVKNAVEDAGYQELEVILNSHS